MCSWNVTVSWAESNSFKKLVVRRQRMRRLVEPPPSIQCDLCQGGLLLKRIESDAHAVQVDVAIYLCVKCGRERSRKVIHDPYAAHASPMRRAAQALAIATPHVPFALCRHRKASQQSSWLRPGSRT